VARKKKSSGLALAPLPKGFKELGSGSSWKGVTIGDTLSGVYVGFETVHQPKKGRIAARDVNVHEIVDDDGVVHKVWESAGLRALASVKKKARVFIQYLGEVVITKGQNPMRKYRVAAK
jgi:hypothetical protein